MDKSISTTYLKINSTSKSLTKNARQQILLKIIYGLGDYISLNNILSEYESILGVTGIDSGIIEQDLQELVANNEIKLSNNKFHLSTSKRRKISEVYAQSVSIEENIIETFFTPFFSDKDVIKEWLKQALFKFFQEYSNAWMSDICYRTTSINSCKEHIIELIRRWTNCANINNLDQRDRDQLVEKFINFITTKNPDVDSFLWEYGTSVFAARLITSSMGADDFTIDAFRGCKCILDTNILMHIGLESSEYYSALKSIEKIFLQLNIEVGVLGITADEYVHTVANKRNEIINAVCRYGTDIVKDASDHYVMTAIERRRCESLDDFERFFECIQNVPEHLDESLEIKCYNDDPSLDKAIESAIQDESRIAALNTIYKDVTGKDKDKRHRALLHDVGLIAGADYLRHQDKYFILSQDISVNEYAKKQPSVNDLPISIKLETIVNMLAISNGGMDINANDYMPLFASIIRKGLAPRKDTFKVEDLSFMLDHNEQIAQLPKYETIAIAKDIHRMRAVDMPEDKIALELTRRIQGAKIRVVDELSKTKSELRIQTEEKARYKDEATISTLALRAKIQDEVIGAYDSNIIHLKHKLWIIPTLILIISAIGVWVIPVIVKSIAKEHSITVGILINIVSNVIWWCFTAYPSYKDLVKNRQMNIESEIDKRVNRAIDSARNIK